MAYHREKVDNEKWDYHVTNHYRDGKLFAVTEQKRKHSWHDCDTLTDMAGRKHRFEAVSDYIQKGLHDHACYVYYFT